MSFSQDAVDLIGARLRRAGAVAYRDEAELLAGSAPEAERLERWVSRRERGEPLAWIIGSITFCDRRLLVDHGVFVPRPHTEDLARRAVVELAEGETIVDLCTGAGAVAAHIQSASPSALVVGVDRDIRAARCARRNGIRAIAADVRRVPLRSGAVDVVTAVPPYVPTDELRLLPRDVLAYEPRLALDGGVDGLEIARSIVMTAADLLREGGTLHLELGGEQLARLGATLPTHGFHHQTPHYDEDGDIRGLTTRKG